jgi:hypothetical protein
MWGRRALRVGGNISPSLFFVWNRNQLIPGINIGSTVGLLYTQQNNCSRPLTHCGISPDSESFVGSEMFQAAGNIFSAGSSSSSYIKTFSRPNLTLKSCGNLYGPNTLQGQCHKHVLYHINNTVLQSLSTEK